MASVARRAVPSEASPYSQPHHFSLQANPNAPKTTEARRRRAAAEEVERCNSYIVSRLEALKREPPSRFHAPDGNLSLRPKHARGPKGPRAVDRKKPEWDDGSSKPGSVGSSVSEATRRAVARSNETRVEKHDAETRVENDAKRVSTRPRAKRTWPVKLQTLIHPTPSEKHEIELANANLRRRLAGQYVSTRESRIVKEGKGFPVDGMQMWARRLAIYDPAAPAGGAKKTRRLERSDGAKNRAAPFSSGIDPATGKCRTTGVPKTLAAARCSATGLLSYFAADGHELREHPDVPNLFYVKKWYDEFREMDATMQRAIVAWHASRSNCSASESDPGFQSGCKRLSKDGAAWRPVRPARESWVVNRHMKLALTLMRRLAKGEREGMTMDNVKRRVAACAAREKVEDARSRAAQKEMDDGAAVERAAVRGLAARPEAMDAKMKKGDNLETRGALGESAATGECLRVPLKDASRACTRSHA
jgi:hypothetical protein